MNYSRASLNKLVKLENSRHEFALCGKRKEFIKTYSENVLTNYNSPSFWDHKFNEVSGRENYIELDRNRTASKWLNEIIHKKQIILNLGCGDGKFEDLFYKDKPGFKYVGIDYAKESIKLLSKRYPRFKFITGDITKYPFEDNYDAVLAFEVFEHISSTKILSLQRKIGNLLKTGGYLMVAVPLNEPLVQMYPNNPNEHVRIYTREIIINELEISGFEIIRFQEFIAFESLYYLKRTIAKVFTKKWKPNDILILAKKK